MPIIDKPTIENFANKVDEEVINNSFSTFSFIISKSMEQLAKRNPMVSADFELLPVNEFYSGAVLPNSKLVFLLAMKSPQLEFNTVKLVNNKLKSFWIRLKLAWKNRKKKSKKHKYINESKPIETTKERYNLNNFNLDLLNTIANNITTDTIVSLNNGVFEISGADIPFICQFYPVIDKNGSYNFYIPNKNKIFNIDFKNRFEYLEQLQTEFGENFTEMIKMFSAVYYNINNSLPNSIFIESLVANLPYETFEKESAYLRFIFAVNILVNKKRNNFFSITDYSKKLIDEPLAECSIMNLTNFMKDLQKYL